MRAACLNSFLVVGALLSGTEPLTAQPLIAHARSIESVVVNSDLVFVARIVTIGDAERVDGQEVHNTTIAIERTLKQDLFTDEPYRKLQMHIPRSGPVLTDWQERSSRLLVAYDADAPYATTVIELVPGNMEIFRADLTLLCEPEEVVRAAEDVLGRMPRGIRRIHTFGLQVPHERITGTEWGKFHGLVLNVPVDEQLKRRALRQIRSEHYHLREEGVRALRYFQSDENVERIKSLLDDPGWGYLYHAQENDGVEVRIYGVRQEAYRTLKSWGVTVEKPTIREDVPHSVRRRRSCSADAGH